MNFITRIFKRMRNQVLPLQTFKVEVLLYSEHNETYFGGAIVTTEARTKWGAKKNIKAGVRLHVGRAWLFKEKVNGTKRIEKKK